MQGFFSKTYYGGESPIATYNIGTKSTEYSPFAKTTLYKFGIDSLKTKSIYELENFVPSTLMFTVTSSRACTRAPKVYSYAWSSN